MRRTNWKTVSTLVTMSLLAGCQEQPLSAPIQSSSAPAQVSLAPDARPQLSLSGGAAENTSADFTVTAKGGVFLVGNHAVVIPAKGICDPATSSYGVGTWDAPCDALAGSLRIHAEVRNELGRTWVDFSPSLRFVPSSNPAKWAYIYMYTPSAAGAVDIAKYNILYAPSIGADPIDESIQDATLRTYVDTRTGMSLRRIKHFSGYTSSSGDKCDPATDPTCGTQP